MSTLNFNANHFSTIAPKWTFSIPEHVYHADARTGEFISSSMLKVFRRCPAEYYGVITGRVETGSSKAFRLGRAAHKLVLEGEAAFRSAFTVGGPWNEVLGKPYSHGCRAFSRWAEEYGVDPEVVVTPAEEADLRRMALGVSGHGEAAGLLKEGWAERVARAEVEGVKCQARIDWLGKDGVGVELKTTSDIGRFEEDARRFGYLHQLAFYRDVVRAAGGGEVEMVAVVVERRKPFRVGVWRFEEAVLEPYAVQNRMALREVAKCRENGRWPTGYEGSRVFPPAGLPRLWLN